MRAMWLISLGFGFGKTRAVQCYVKLLIWIVIVSLGLYWFLNRNGGTKENVLWNLENYRDRWDSTYHQNQFNYDAEDGEVTNKNNNNNNDNKGRDFLNLYTNSKSRKDSKTTWGLGHQKKFVQFKDSPSTVASKNEPSYGFGQSFLHSSITRLCNPPEEIQVKDENLIVPEFKLDALVIVMRHGDRGPLSHIGPTRNISLVNCSSDNPEFQKFYKFTSDSISRLGGYSNFIGPFHSFQKVPTNGQCHLGQLSQLGSWQLQKLGKTIRAAYQNTLFGPTSFINNINNSPVAATKIHSNVSHYPQQSNNNDLTGHLFTQNNIKVISYSTRYRRTLQSLMAFLYGLLGPKYIVPNVTIRESQSITFCFNDCSCRNAETLKKLAAKKYHPNPKEKTTMINLINRINSILGSEKVKKSGTTLLDLLLLYPCHNSDLPCREPKEGRKSSLFAEKTKQFTGAADSEDCVQKEDISTLIGLLQKENYSQKKIPASRQLSLLSSYGLLKEIVTLALTMTSSTSSQHGSNTPYSNNYNNNNFHTGNSKTKIAVFSGHDTTLSGLTGALGMYTGHPDIHLVPYASRLIFEFYRKTNIPPNSARKHYFRVIYNGEAVTHLIRFCQESDRIVLVNNVNNLNNNINTNTKSNDAGMKHRNILCPFENLVRFLHDHYFETFGNATNFKDACQKKRKKRKK